MVNEEASLRGSHSLALRCDLCGNSAPHGGTFAPCPGACRRWLQDLLRRAHHRGSDVHLESQTLADGTSQIYPYPASAWNWSSVQEYPWAVVQHTNALELAVFSVIFG